jgi:hypothetical protein
MREYQAAHSAAKVVGKTAEQIVSMYGPPYAMERGEDGKAIAIMYKDVKHGQYCGIHFEKGLAVGVSFWGQ